METLEYRISKIQLKSEWMVQDPDKIGKWPNNIHRFLILGRKKSITMHLSFAQGYEEWRYQYGKVEEDATITGDGICYVDLSKRLVLSSTGDGLINIPRTVAQKYADHLLQQLPQYGITTQKTKIEMRRPLHKYWLDKGFDPHDV